MRNSAVMMLCLLAIPARSLGQELMPKQIFSGWFANPPATKAQKQARADRLPNPKSETPVSDSQPVTQASLTEFAMDACNSRGDCTASGRCTASCGCKTSCGCTASCGSDCGGGCHWTHECFPRRGCPDDY